MGTAIGNRLHQERIANDYKRIKVRIRAMANELAQCHGAGKLVAFQRILEDLQALEHLSETMSGELQQLLEEVER